MLIIKILLTLLGIVLLLSVIVFAGIGLVYCYKLGAINGNSKVQSDRLCELMTDNPDEWFKKYMIVDRKTYTRILFKH